MPYIASVHAVLYSSRVEPWAVRLCIAKYWTLTNTLPFPSLRIYGGMRLPDIASLPVLVLFSFFVYFTSLMSWIHPPLSFLVLLNRVLKLQYRCSSNLFYPSSSPGELMPLSDKGICQLLFPTLLFLLKWCFCYFQASEATGNYKQEAGANPASFKGEQENVKLANKKLPNSCCRPKVILHSQGVRSRSL